MYCTVYCIFYYAEYLSNNRTAYNKRNHFKTLFHLACKDGKLYVIKLMMVNNRFKTFSINLNVQHHMHGY